MNSDDTGHSGPVVPRVPELGMFVAVQPLPPALPPSRRYVPMYKLFVNRYLFRHIKPGALYEKVSTHPPESGAASESHA